MSRPCWSPVLLSSLCSRRLPNLKSCMTAIVIWLARQVPLGSSWMLCSLSRLRDRGDGRLRLSQGRGARRLTMAHEVDVAMPTSGGRGVRPTRRPQWGEPQGWPPHHFPSSEPLERLPGLSQSARPQPQTLSAPRAPVSHLVSHRLFGKLLMYLFPHVTPT